MEKVCLIVLILSTSLFAGVEKISKSSSELLKKNLDEMNCDLDDLLYDLRYKYGLSSFDAELLVDSFEKHLDEMIDSGVVPDRGIYGVSDLEELEDDLFYNTSLSRSEVRDYVLAVRRSQLLSDSLRVKVRNNACTGENLIVD